MFVVKVKIRIPMAPQIYPIRVSLPFLILEPQCPIIRLPINELAETAVTNIPYPSEPAFKILSEKTGNPIDIGPLENNIIIIVQVIVNISKTESFFIITKPFLMSERILRREMFSILFLYVYFIGKNIKLPIIKVYAEIVNRLIYPNVLIKNPPDKYPTTFENHIAESIKAFAG